MHYDIVILGGGPAGIASAITLSRAGISTALIEKYPYPREKACAGILTHKAISLLEEKLSFSQIKQEFSSNKVSIMYQQKNARKFAVQYPFVFIERIVFDQKLIRICQNENTHIMEGLTVTKLLPDKNEIILSNDQALTYKGLVIADGVFSPTRKHLGLTNLPMAFCVQDTVERSSCPMPLRELQEIQLNFGDIQSGYSWIVPYHNNIALGSGSFTNLADYSAFLSAHESLCEQIGLPKKSKRQGAFVPIGGFDCQTMHPYENIVIVGDAAGLANPLTGEGIYHALLSGFYAGQSYLLDPQNFRATYLSLLQPVIEQLKEQLSLLPKFYNQNMLGNFFYQFKDCPEYLSTICDNVISLEDRSYRSLIIEMQELMR